MTDPDLLNLAPTPVARPANPWVAPLGVGAAVLAGALVFVAMSTGRAEKSASAAGPALAAAFEPAPPPLDVQPSAPVEDTGDSIPAPYMAGLSEQAPPPGDVAGPAPAPNTGVLDQRRRSPSVVVDLSAPPVGAAAAPAVAVNVAGAQSLAASLGDSKAGGDEAFARRLASETTGAAQSSRIAQPALTAPQGTVVPAVLETAINSDLPGFVRAVVSRDVRAFDGSTLVIPRGAKLVGQYRNAVAAGQSRAFVVWTRLIRPDGVTIELASPGADALGRGGLEGRTDQHFFQRFGAAILLSVVSGATARESGAVVISSAQDASRIAEIALQKQIDIPPTIKVAQGTPIRVFVARDLVFESASSR